MPSLHAIGKDLVPTRASKIIQTPTDEEVRKAANLIQVAMEHRGASLEHMNIFYMFKSTLELFLTDPSIQPVEYLFPSD